MSLRELIADYREPITRMVGLTKFPGNHSCDNGLLFSATYMVLEGNSYADEVAWFHELVGHCQPEAVGWIVRYPGTMEVVAHDDLTGIVAVSELLSELVLLYGSYYWWSWGLKPKTKSLRTWWGRIADFPPTVMAGAGARVGILHQILWSIDTMASCLTEKGNTSGKCLSYLKIKTMEKRSYWLPSLAIRFWRRRMGKVYPGGMRDVYRIYFGESHPFTIAGPPNFL